MPPKGSKIPQPRRESLVERTPEYDEFISKLKEFHEKRGTLDIFDSEPKVSVHYINLKDLYDRVIEEGGYDLVSDTKARPLMWRKLAEEFVGRGPHVAAQAFQVKSAYYKNLSAYEIQEHWKEEAPPREILEDLTAKGGGVRGRTMDSFERPGNRETDRLANGDNSDDEDGESTPKPDKMDLDEQEGTGRSTRGLRQAPPQRVLFQPDVGPARQSRSAANLTSPSPGAIAVNSLSNPSFHTNGTNTTLANFEPRQQYPLSLKPVTTPANNPDLYRLKRKQQQDASASQIAKRFKGLMLPGTGFIGPNIYVRAQMALQSGLAEEEQYALHHLVKISHERGDKYRFDQFPGLAEALINKVLQLSSLFYDIDWLVTYNDNSKSTDDDESLSGLYGTSDILQKLKSRTIVETNDNMQDAEFLQSLGRVIEAGLIIRNMVMLDENAQYVARLPLLRDYFCVVLGIKHPAVVELQHYALETAEQISPYYQIDSKDPLYKSLLAQLEGQDRGKIVTTLRTVSRLGMHFPENKRLEDVPERVLHTVCEWAMIEDDDMRSACLDFLFQFTSISDNVEILIRTIDVKALVRQLVGLLLSNAKEYAKSERQRKPVQQEPAPHPTQVPRLARELIEQLLKHDEPERSSHWLRMCFQDDATAEMTQIDLWKSYQGTFLPYAATHPHLIAGDFIKNVSSTFTGASAQVAGQNKYVIRGIKPRKIPVDYRGRELLRCRWITHSNGTVSDTATITSHPNGTECRQFFPNSASLLEHIVSQHLQVPRKRPTPDDKADKPTGTLNSSMKLFDFAAGVSNAKLECSWSSCRHTTANHVVSKEWVRSALLARHIETHLPTGPLVMGMSDKDVKANEASEATKSSTWSWLNTVTDENQDAAGVPLGACLVMRNIARGIFKMAPESNAQKEALEKTEVDGVTSSAAQPKEGEEQAKPAASGNALLMKRIFDPIKDRLFFAMAHNMVIKERLQHLLIDIAKGGGLVI